jgi:DNA polymerase-3 subunit beta
MELSVRQSDLLRELQLFQGIVERKNTIPILGNVLLEANGEGGLQMLATDLEVGLRSQCAAEISEPGSVTIPAKKLFEIVRALPETEIRIQEGAKGAVEVAAAQFDSRMQTLPREDFPTVPEPGSGWSAVLPRAALGEMVAKTQFAITGEDTRYFLNGALFVLKSGTMSLIATDGHRLALATSGREGPDVEGGEVQAILPKKTLGELSRLLASGEGEVRYTRGESHLFFEIDGRQLISRMIDAQFPAYERVIPTGNDKKVDFERDRLTSAIRRVALLSSERSHAVKFQIAESTAEVTSSSPELGEAKEVLPVDYGGAELQICFNAQYVLDFLAVADTDSVTLEFKDDRSQAVMYPSGEKAAYTYVIMPMRV